MFRQILHNYNGCMRARAPLSRPGTFGLISGFVITDQEQLARTYLLSKDQAGGILFLYYF